MIIKFTVEVELNHTQGKFASKEELAEQLKAEIEGADPGSVTGDNDGEYEVSSFNVEIVDE